MQTVIFGRLPLLQIWLSSVFSNHYADIVFNSYMMVFWGALSASLMFSY